MMIRYKRRYRRLTRSPVVINGWAIIVVVAVLGLLTWWRLASW